MARYTSALKAPAGSGAALRAGGRICRRRHRVARVAVEFERRRGRGAQSNAVGRYEPQARIAFDDGWRSLDETAAVQTTVQTDATRKISPATIRPTSVSTVRSNPYRGANTACVYCFARPTHAYLGHVARPGFRIQIARKPEAAELLEKELASPSYSPKVIAIGTNTDVSARSSANIR